MKCRVLDYHNGTLVYYYPNWRKYVAMAGAGSTCDSKPTLVEAFSFDLKYRKIFSCVVKLKALNNVGRSYTKVKLRPVGGV